MAPNFTKRCTLTLAAIALALSAGMHTSVSVQALAPVGTGPRPCALCDRTAPIEGAAATALFSRDVEDAYLCSVAVVQRSPQRCPPYGPGTRQARIAFLSERLPDPLPALPVQPLPAPEGSVTGYVYGQIVDLRHHLPSPRRGRGRATATAHLPVQHQLGQRRRHRRLQRADVGPTQPRGVHPRRPRRLPRTLALPGRGTRGAAGLPLCLDALGRQPIARARRPAVDRRDASAARPRHGLRGRRRSAAIDGIWSRPVNGLTTTRSRR